MPRSLVLLLILVVLVAAGLFVLAGRAHEKPTQRIEKAVSLANLAG